jgi:hypothetical protein
LRAQFTHQSSNCLKVEQKFRIPKPQQARPENKPSGATRRGQSCSGRHWSGRGRTEHALPEWCPICANRVPRTFRYCQTSRPGCQVDCCAPHLVPCEQCEFKLVSPHLFGQVPSVGAH